MIPQRTSDGRMVVASYQAPLGWRTFLTGCGDDPAAPDPIGGGPPILLSFDGPEVKETPISLVSPVYLHNGDVNVSGEWTVEDRFSLLVIMPATEFDLGGNLDVLKVPIGPGVFAWMPCNPGDGTHNFNDTKAIPVPSSNGQIASWNVNLETSEVLPVIGSSGAFALLSFQVQIHFARNVPLGANGFHVDTDQSEWISNKWSMKFSVDKKSTGAGKAAGSLFLFRK